MRQVLLAAALGANEEAIKLLTEWAADEPPKSLSAAERRYFFLRFDRHFYRRPATPKMPAFDATEARPLGMLRGMNHGR